MSISKPSVTVIQPRPRITSRFSSQTRVQTSTTTTKQNKKSGKNHPTIMIRDKNNQGSIKKTNSSGHPKYENRNANGQLKPGFPALPGAGGRPGNQNPHNGRIVKQAFMNELRKVFKAKLGRADTLSGLEAIAGKVIKMAMKSSLPAAREVFDRVDGRPAQTIIGDPDNPVFFKNVSEMSDEELEVVARGHVINGTAERVD